MALPQQEFCIKLSMSSIEGRPLSVSLARFDDIDNPLIGVSLGFLALSGLDRRDAVGRNCRFLNAGLPMPLRERLRYCVRGGAPFMGVLQNMRHLGGGQTEIFENLLHLVVFVCGTRRYILGMQADVTGLNLDLVDGSRDAARLQKIFDSVLSASVDSWVHFQEGMFQSAPLYLHVRLSGSDEDDVYIKEDWEHSISESPTLVVPDQYMVLAPRFPKARSDDEALKFRFIQLGDCSDPMPNTAGGTDSVSTEAAAPVISISQALTGVETPTEACQSSCASASTTSSLSPSASTWTSTMKNQLRALNDEDPANVLSARGISKLGTASAAKLRAHFSHYGQVKAVHVPFVFKKRSREPRSAGRCFIVMDSPETAARILAEGSSHFVDGVAVSIERFSAKQSSDSAD